MRDKSHSDDGCPDEIVEAGHDPCAGRAARAAEDRKTAAQGSGTACCGGRVQPQMSVRGYPAHECVRGNPAHEGVSPWQPVLWRAIFIVLPALTAGAVVLVVLAV